MTGRPPPAASTALVFLVRGRDAAWEASLRRFLASWRRHPAGLAHDLVLVCKGFDDPSGQRLVEEEAARAGARCLPVEDGSFDLGAYRDAARMLLHERLCFLNGHSEILADGWLLKLARQLDRPDMGMVGCTGSFEVPRDFPSLRHPNVHLRTNGFLLGRGLFLEAVGGRAIRRKQDAYALESGPASLTRTVLSLGLGIAVVGADGQGYPPRLWPRSRTFRLGRQDNLLVGDNQTRAVATMTWDDRAFLARHTWGRYLTELLPPGMGRPQPGTVRR